MQDVFVKIKTILCSDCDFIIDEKRIRPANSEVFRLWGDNRLIKELAGFTPDYTIDNGLKETCNWFAKSNIQTQYKADIYNV